MRRWVKGTPWPTAAPFSSDLPDGQARVISRQSWEIVYFHVLVSSYSQFIATVKSDYQTIQRRAGPSLCRGVLSTPELI